MQAKTQHTLFCECNFALEYVGTEYVRCNNARCPHHGKRFALPAFELVEIVPPRIETAVAAVAAAGAQEET